MPIPWTEQQQREYLMSQSVMDEPRSIPQHLADFLLGRTLPEQMSSAFTGGAVGATVPGYPKYVGKSTQDLIGRALRRLTAEQFKSTRRYRWPWNTGFKSNKQLKQLYDETFEELASGFSGERPGAPYFTETNPILRGVKRRTSTLPKAFMLDWLERNPTGDVVEGLKNRMWSMRLPEDLVAATVQRAWEQDPAQVSRQLTPQRARALMEWLTKHGLQAPPYIPGAAR